MHESGIVRDLVRRVEQARQEAGATRIAAISVWLGALTQFSDHHFREHFEEDAQGTAAETARLHLELSDDPLHPDAQRVILRSIELEVPDAAA